MNCLHCNAPLENTYVCPKCGHKDNIARKIIYCSNRHYNQGLAKARIRDLSGAQDSLRQALKYNKRNTQARNLLGLVYYQTGELVAALGEWVISMHFQQDNNIASEYITQIQMNQDKLKAANKVIHRYNMAIGYIRDNNADLAIIELKKVVNMSPTFIKAYQLLALLYMQRKQYSAARKILAAAVKVDRNNMTTLGYLKELNQLQQKPSRSQLNQEARRINDPNPIVIEENPDGYRDYSTSFVSFINVLIGIVIGVSVIGLLVVPSITKHQANAYNQAIVEYSAQISERNRDITTLQDEIAELTTKLSRYEEEGTQITAPDTVSDAHLIQAISYYLQDSILSAGLEVAEVDPASITDSETKRVYEILVNSTKDKATPTLYENTYALYEQGEYLKVVEGMTKVLRLDSTYTGAIYYMARSYHMLGDVVNAMTYYQQIISLFPDSSYYSDAQKYYDQLYTNTGVSVDAPEETEAETRSD